ncbi:MAG: hypothetical protein KDC12_13810 [Flavobacteriales bacterium]|nr:hypothetical protein [Flavobacteriales bacterium]
MAAFVLFNILAVTSCKKDPDPVDQPAQEENEGEIITTMIVEVSDSAGVLPHQSFIFRDEDGPGGNEPSQFDTLLLAPETTYFVSIVLLNETITPADTISLEVLEEGEDHLFCFTVSGLDLDIIRTDSDGTYEIGLESTWHTGATGMGDVQIELKHQPGIKDGTCDPGETDVDLTFETHIE